MATSILINPSVFLDDVDYSDAANMIALSESADTVDQTGFGAEYRTTTPTLKAWSFAVDIMADGATAETLRLLNGTTVPMKIRSTSDVVSATNPEHFGDVTITEVSIMNGEPGANRVVSITGTGTGALSSRIVPEA